MLDSYIVNHNAQFLLGVYEAVRNTIIFKRIPCSILGVYASNYFGLARASRHSYKVLEGNTRGSFGGFLRDILIKGGFFVDENSHLPDRSMLN